MKKLAVFLFGMVCAAAAQAQSTETAAIRQTIATLFDGMRKADTAMLRSAFVKDMVLQSIANKADGTTALITEKADDFVKAIGAPHKEVYDERLGTMDIKIDGALASVWAPYKFYVGTQFSHCGVDVFQLMKTAAGWKIINIVDTRRKDGCVE